MSVLGLRIVGVLAVAIIAFAVAVVVAVIIASCILHHFHILEPYVTVCHTHLLLTQARYGQCTSSNTQCV